MHGLIFETSSGRINPIPPEPIFKEQKILGNRLVEFLINL